MQMCKLAYNHNTHDNFLGPHPTYNNNLLEPTPYRQGAENLEPTFHY